jgi:hypothetical protein
MASDGQEKFIDQLLRETFEFSAPAELSNSPRPLERQITVYSLLMADKYIRLETDNFKLDFPKNWGPFEKLENHQKDDLLLIGENDQWKLSEIFPLVDIYGPSWVFAKISGEYYLLSSDRHRWTPNLTTIMEFLNKRISSAA